MTGISMTVREYLRKAGIELYSDFLAQAAGLVAQMTMELEVEQQIGAAKHSRTPTRTTQRNGYRERSWATRGGGDSAADSKTAAGQLLSELAGTAAAGGTGVAGGGATSVHRGGQHAQGG